jgi:hypothetical protein
MDSLYVKFQTIEVYWLLHYHCVKIFELTKIIEMGG